MSIFSRRTAAPASYSAVLVAAGSSLRMGRDKLLLDLCGEPVIIRSIQALSASERVANIVVVVREEQLSDIAALISGRGLDKVTAVVKGGKTRQQSVEAGLAAVSQDSELVLIHDGARPLVTVAVIDEAVAACEKYGAAAPALPVKDTIKRASGKLVSETLKRSELFAMQTPQVFQRELLLAALQNAEKKDIELTDDCSAVEALGMRVVLTDGDEENIKLTTPNDFSIARFYYLRRQKRCE